MKAGVDASFFTIDERGALSFTNPPNFEARADSGGDNVYDVTVQARDDAFNTASLPDLVTVTDVNEGPEVSGRDSYTVSENGDLTGAFFTAVDPEGADITGWSLLGTDGGDFVIDESGQLTFRNVTDYVSPADSNRNNEYLVSVRACDGHSSCHRHGHRRERGAGGERERQHVLPRESGPGPTSPSPSPT